MRRAAKPEYARFNIVHFGGGGGSEAVLRAFWRIAKSLAAILCVFDDGGDSGHLREGLGWAPGDVRRACVALAASWQSLMARLFQVRFGAQFPDRTGQCFGNTFFAAASQCGLDLAEQIEAAARLLGVTAHIYPAATETLRLVGETDGGDVVHGETAIAACPLPIRRVRLDPECASLPAGARRAIRCADAVVAGPGSILTSVIPALLPAMEAVAASPAARFLVVNAWNEGEYDRRTASDYVRLVASHYPERLFDCVICHQFPAGSGGCADGRRPVEADLDAIHALGYEVVSADLLAPDGRHDGERLAALIARLTPQFSRQLPMRPQAGEARYETARLTAAYLEGRRTSCKPAIEQPSEGVPCRARRRLATRASGTRTRLPARCGKQPLRRHQTAPYPVPASRGAAGANPVDRLASGSGLPSSCL